MRALIFIEANGKAQAWARITRKLGMTAQVVATTGHVCSFPERLNPIGIDLRPGKNIEKLRAPKPEKQQLILEAVKNTPPKTAIVIATDNDVEGDVIAYDVLEIICRAFPDRQGAIVRVRPGPITMNGVRASLASAQPMAKAFGQMKHDAIPGRARAITDRWIGATFSKIAGVPVGRVRSAILGAALLLNKQPARLRGRPETGEITLQARSGSGGRPFVARIPLFGTETPAHVQRLKRLAIKFKFRIIPGVVRPAASLSAAVAPRCGSVRPFNTADILAYAARHYRIPVKTAMQGLQDSYLQGLISYPRTDSRDISKETAVRVQMLGYGCGLEGLEADYLSSDTILNRGPSPDAHEGLHPVLPLSTANTAFLRELVRKPIKKPDAGWDRAGIMQIMTTLVSRRAFEASREIWMERGSWTADNGDDMDIDAQDMEILRDLEWFRDMNFTFPWTRNFATGVQSWPLDGIVLEMMAEEGIGRPSTYANHVDTAVNSGDIMEGEFPNPPRPTPKGIQTLKKTPVSVWNPAICRMIEDALENKGNILREDTSGTLQARARHRVLGWLNRVPDDYRKPLLEALVAEDSARGINSPARAAPAAAAPDTPTLPEVSTDLPEPTPYSH